MAVEVGFGVLVLDIETVDVCVMLAEGVLDIVLVSVEDGVFVTVSDGVEVDV